MLMDFELVDARNSDIKSEWGAYGIASVRLFPGDMLEYFNY